MDGMGATIAVRGNVTSERHIQGHYTVRTLPEDFGWGHNTGSEIHAPCDRQSHGYIIFILNTHRPAVRIPDSLEMRASHSYTTT